ncbi:MAG: efflux RND transporter periplasmic adaptor subunit [Acidobacteriota bacterium]
MTSRKAGLTLSRKAVLGMAVAVFAAVVLWLSLASYDVDPDAAPPRPTRIVSVLEVSAGRHTAEILGLAEVRPRWESNLRARVGGVLNMVSAKLQPGSPVKAGEVLATIDRTPWLANLAEAENRLALAELDLLRERQEAEQARDSWRESGLTGEPRSGLVLREPQIEAAEVQVEAARAARDWAARQLADTEIRSPFAGVVAARHVSRGESVLEGEAVAQIFATEVFEIPWQVSESQWRQLPDSVIGALAELRDAEGSGRWSAKVVRTGRSVDPTTRMRTLHLAVDAPLNGAQPLLPGTFVQVGLEGRAEDRVLELPEGVLTRSGHVWFVDEQDSLRRFEAEPLFTRHGLVYVKEPNPAAAWRIVRHPLDTFMVGLAVRPTEIGADARGES